MKGYIMRSITSPLVAVALLLAVGIPSFAGETGSMAGCKSSCNACEPQVTVPAGTNGYGPKGGPIGKQMTSATTTQPSAFLTATADVGSATPIPGAKGLVRGIVQATPRSQAAVVAASNPTCTHLVANLDRGPKGGYVVTKGVADIDVHQRVDAQCRMACH
jgi:hypothetical protein